MAASSHESKQARSSHPQERGHLTPVKNKKALPDGACHYKDLSAGERAPQCGCQRFWIDPAASSSAPLTGTGTQHLWEKPRCMCGHYANYHKDAAGGKASSAGDVQGDGTVNITSALGSLIQALQWMSRGSAHNKPPPCQSCSSLGMHGGVPYTERESRKNGTPQTRASPSEKHQQLGAVQSGYEQQGDEPSDRPWTRVRPASDTGHIILPPIPSQCLMNSEELQFSYERRLVSNDAHHVVEGASKPNKCDRVCSDQSLVPGLGISFQSRTSDTQPIINRSRETARLPDQHDRTDLDNRLYLPHESLPRRPNPRSLPCDAISACKNNAPNGRDQTLLGADMWTTIANPHSVLTDGALATLRGFGLPEDFVQSATEIATPTQAGTPDWKALRGSDAASREFRALVDEVSHHASGQYAKQTTPQHRARQTHSDNNEDNVKPSESVSFSDGDETPRPAGSTNRPRVAAQSTDSSPLLQSLQRLVGFLDRHASHLSAYPDLATTVRIHAKRLDCLENGSITNSPLEDVSDRIELLDGRVTDVEGTVEELNKHLVLDDDGTNDRHRLKRLRKAGAETSINSSFISNASGLTTASGASASSSALIAAAIDRVELISRVEALEAKVADIEHVAGPSPARPWEIEVVVLPWGRGMRGIWDSVDDAMSAQSKTAEWTQSRSNLRRTRINASSKDQVGWNGESIQLWAEDTGDWKSARACNNRSRVYKRLASRGLVFNVQIVGRSAMDVKDAIMSEHGDIIKNLESMASSDGNRLSPSRSLSGDGGGTFLGLKSPFIPLRKFHKDSKLGFLSCEELVTPTLWTVEFLASSVVMKRSGGQRTLFVTHPAGYLQSEQGCGADWTWPNLRQLPRVNHGQPPTEGGAAQVLEANAKEPCWEWDPRLDPPVSTYSSFSSLSSCHSAVQVHGPLTEPSIHTVPECARIPAHQCQPRDLPASPMSEFPPDARSQQYARISIEGPQAVTATVVPKRRDVSQDITVPSKAPVKRRRISRSPSREPSIYEVPFNATPRISNPMSPFFSQIPVAEARSQTGAASNSKRGVTPTAYATPYSGPVSMDYRSRLRQSDDRPGQHGNNETEHPDDHPWEGLDEGEDGGIDDSDDDDDDNESSCFSGVDEDGPS